jgi:hypothetical protein
MYFWWIKITVVKHFFQHLLTDILTLYFQLPYRLMLLVTAIACVTINCFSDTFVAEQNILVYHFEQVIFKV